MLVIIMRAAIDDSTYLHQPTAVSGPIHESCFVLKGNIFFVINDVRAGLFVIISFMYDVRTLQTETMMAKQFDCKLGQPPRLTV